MAAAGQKGRALDAQTLLALGYGVVGGIGVTGLALPLLRMTFDLDVLDSEFSPTGAAEIAEDLGVDPGTVGAIEVEFGFQSLGMTWLPGAVIPILLIVAAVVGIGAVVTRPVPGDRRHGAVAATMAVALAYSLLSLGRFPGPWASMSGALRDEWDAAMEESDWMQLTPGAGLILVWCAGAVVLVLAAGAWWLARAEDRAAVADPEPAVTG